MIRKCTECKAFTLKEEHCEKDTVTSRPPKFSFPDKYGEYRRKTKRKGESE
jgi:rRNA maturation protein Nop10